MKKNKVNKKLLVRRGCAYILDISFSTIMAGFILFGYVFSNDPKPTLAVTSALIWFLLYYAYFPYKFKWFHSTTLFNRLFGIGVHYEKRTSQGIFIREAVVKHMGFMLTFGMWPLFALGYELVKGKSLVERLKKGKIYDIHN